MKSERKNLVYWTPSKVQLVVISFESGQALMIDYETIDLAQGDPAAKIKSFLKGKPPVWTAVMPPSGVLWKELPVPSHDDYEIEKMVRLSMKTALWDAGELVFDYCVTTKRSDGYADVRVAVVHADILEQYRNFLHVYGIRCQGWIVGPASGELLPDVAESELFHWIPNDVRQRLIDRLWLRQWIVCGGLALALCMLIASFAGMHYFQKAAQLKTLQHRVQAIQKRMDRVEHVLRRVDAARNRLDRRLFLADLLGRIDELRGAGVYLNRFERMDRDILLQGVASDENQINAFQSRLIASRLFDDVALQYAQRKPQGSQEGVYFKIRCQKEQL